MRVKVSGTGKPGSLASKPLLFGVIGFGVLIVALLTSQFYRERLATVREEQGRALITIADVKAAELVSWRRERLADADVMSRNKELGHFVRTLKRARRPEASIPASLRWIEQMRFQHNYSAVRIFDASATLRLSLPPTPDQPQQDASSHATAIRVIHQRTVAFEDFHRDKGEPAHLAVFAPLFDTGSDPVGAIEFQIDPERILYKQLQVWPVPSRSGETLLVRREEGEAVYLNQLRYREGVALAVRVPLTQTDLPAVRAALGRDGVVEGKDYRHVAVLAAVRRVPDSPWFLVTKIDRSEAFSAVAGATRLFATMSLLIVAIGVCGVILILSRRESEQYQRLYAAETERRALVSHYEYLHRYANDIILLLDEQGHIIEANDRAVESYGYAREQLITLNIRDLRDPATLSAFEEQWAAAESGAGVLFEALHRRADGSVFPVEVSSRVIRVDERLFRQSIIRDISERKRSQEALRHSEATLRHAQRIARIGSWEVLLETPGAEPRRDGYAWSDEVYRIFGVERGTFEPGRASFLESVHPDDRERVEAAMAKVRQTGSMYEIEHRIIQRGGAVRHVREHADCIVDEHGQPVRMIGTVQDITDYKQLEEQFLQAQKLEGLGRLAGGVAHDFNNLLTVIDGYSHLALRDARQGDPIRDYIDEVRRAAQSAAALTRQLLVFSRKQRIQAQKVDLNGAITDIQKMLCRMVGEDIAITVKLDPTIGTILADPGQIQQVLMNLVVNARDAMPRDGSIIVETSSVTIDEAYQDRHADVQPGSYVLLAVSDTGIGMDDTVKSRLFEPFFTTKPRGMGTGLGLSTVYGIVKQTGGWIWVYSELGKGTTFKVYLPQAAAAEIAQAATEAPQQTDGSETILIVEDQSEVRIFAARALRSYMYTVMEAANAEEALTVFEETPAPIDLVVSDVVMPGASGPELMESLKERYPAIKVLFMSGYTEHVTVQNGGIGTDSVFVEKPFTAERLAAKVREALGKR